MLKIYGNVSKEFWAIEQNTKLNNEWKNVFLKKMTSEMSEGSLDGMEPVILWGCKKFCDSAKMIKVKL